ncbi:MAG: HPr family phosphocarrier protein [Spirochaetales bacterium]|nr:HPr family phosphocarrier protein [Spirochaetales bacterium]
MLTETLTVKTRAGIHARPASQIVKTAQQFKSDIFFVKDNMKINGKSIMGVITLGATYNSQLEVECSGPDEEAMITAIKSLFDNHFEEV